MRKKDIEKLINSITLDAENLGYKFSHEVKDNINLYYFFVKESNQCLFTQYIRFMRPNFLKCDSEISVSNKQISSLIKTISPNCLINSYTNGGYDISENETFSILKFALGAYIYHEKILTGEHKFQWNRINMYNITIDREPISLELKSKEIIDTYFKPVVNNLIPQLDSISKIDAIINNFNELKLPDVEPPTLSICFPYSQQFVMGLLLANYLNRADKIQLTTKYLELAASYGEDDYGYIELLKKAGRFYNN